MSDEREVQIGAPLYGGSFSTSDASLALPLVLGGEKIAASAAGELLRVVEASAQRVVPACIHFGACGGCQYQMAGYDEQLAMKRTILEGLLHGAGLEGMPKIATHAAAQYGYRNRIRLQMRRVDGTYRVGYNRRGTGEFLPVTMCPIAAPVLWQVAEAVTKAANDGVMRSDLTLAHWFSAASEIELFCDETTQRVQMALFCAPRTKAPATGQPGHFAAFFALLQAAMPAGVTLVGAGAEAFDARTGPTGRTLAAAGAPGMNYTVGMETYWIARGGFFQVNRLLVETLVQLVCAGRRGMLAWDLYAGVGLFSRVLARAFAQVTAVESNETAVADLNAHFKKQGGPHTAIAATTLGFLERAMLQRERPELIVLDPPRAGVGVEACALLNRLAPAQMVYVSCDPTSLVRDLGVLRAAYRVRALHLVDMFPQTFHLETVAVLDRIG